MNGLARKRILVFCRSYLVADFRENVAPLADKYDFKFLTDGACRGTADTRAAFYAALRTGERHPEIDAATEADVVARCRLLRNIDGAQARRMLHAMAIALDARLSEIDPQVVFCHWVDEYSLHLLSILSRRRRIKFIAYAAAYFPNLVQFTDHSNGRALHVREPAAAEVAETLEAVSPRDFRQDYRQPARHSLLRQARGVARYNVKRLVFKAKSILENDPWGMHYRITPYVVDRRSLRDYPSASLFEREWQTSLKAMRDKRPDAPVVFLPLAYFPEASTDYWITDRSILDYENVVVRIAEVLSRSCIVLVKEHPHMIGGRRPSFYERFQRLSSVINIDPYAYSADVLGASNAVIVGGGSVGIEAYLRDKPILTYCDNSYWYPASQATFLSLSEIDAWPKLICHAAAHFRAPTSEDKLAFVRECLRTTMHTRKEGRIWPLVEVSELDDLLSRL